MKKDRFVESGRRGLYILLGITTVLFFVISAFLPDGRLADTVVNLGAGMFGALITAGLFEGLFEGRLRISEEANGWLGQMRESKRLATPALLQIDILVQKCEELTLRDSGTKANEIVEQLTDNLLALKAYHDKAKEFLAFVEDKSRENRSLLDLRPDIAAAKDETAIFKARLDKYEELMISALIYDNIFRRQITRDYYLRDMREKLKDHEFYDAAYYQAGIAAMKNTKEGNDVN